jgi:Xaa-Pro aminopeptidase
MNDDDGERPDPGGRHVPAAEIARRTAALQAALQAAGIEAAFIVQRVDLYYFSGTAQNGVLFVPAEGPPALLVKQSLARARAESPLDNVIGIERIREAPARIADLTGRLPRRIGFELDVLPVNDFRFYRELLGAPDCPDASPLILAVRAVKSDWELARLDAAAEMTRRLFAYAGEALAPGLSETAFAGMIEAHARTLGHGGKLRVRHFNTEGYFGHVLSGASGGLVGLLDAPASGAGTSPAFPVGAGWKPLAAGEPVMVDLGTVLDGYHLDETRMFALGAMPEKARRAAQAAIAIHDAVLARAAPGVPAGELYELAWEQARAAGWQEAFLGPPGRQTAFIGHGIGLELVEPPFLARGRDTPLAPGMVFALEPKFVCANEFAAGIESVFAVTAGGARLISRVPVEIFIRKGLA